MLQKEVHLVKKEKTLGRPTLARTAKIGIINRGEAAVRFIRAVKEFNLLHGTQFSTVAYYIEAESDALFVKEADSAYNLHELPGYGTFTGSPYLNCPFLVNALLSHGCEGIWVGWGFVAENADFAALAEEKGLVLIGPTALAMDLLGDKIKAKELADQSRVPTCPWSGGPLESLEHAQKMAEKIGYPVILKSANGGGGRGIRKVFTAAELPQQFQSVSDEIYRFYGNRVIFMEALVVRGRHLEVQCLADIHGNVHTFGVRDCSVQRNNQKIIEETPPAHLPADFLKEVEASAERLLKAAKYHGAGTVEYLYDIDRKQAFFMEVNTRLQVEHPITEQLFQIDLVQLQLRVAMGEVLQHLPKEPHGHVIELRLNAEDPDQKFAPTPGQIKRFILPNLPGIRIDSGFEWGSRIPSDFDSMIAKIIAHGPNRAATIAKLVRTLNELQIEIENGSTNQGFLLELLSNEAVKAGGVQTDFVEGFLVSPERRKIKTNWNIAVVAAAIYQYEKRYAEEFENFTDKVRRFSAPRVMPELTAEVQLSANGQQITALVRSVADHTYHIQIGEQLVEVEYVSWGDEIILKAGGRKHKLQIVPRADALQCEVDGIPYFLPIDSGGKVKAPSPSVVLTVQVKEGSKVKKGDLLLTLEAMKMEMTVSAIEDGTVTGVMVRPGEQVAAGQVLIDIEAAGDGTKEEAKVQEQQPAISFSALEIPKVLPQDSYRQRVWQALRRDYLACFLGFDYMSPVGQNLQQIEQFLEEHEDYRKTWSALLIDSIRAFIKVQRLFTNDLYEADGTRSADVHECFMHYLLRREDREKGLPAPFLERMTAAIHLYGWGDVKNHETTTRALFHLYKAYANKSDAVELLRLSLLLLQRHFKTAEEFTSPEEFSDLLNELVTVGKSGVLIDSATFTRFELVDRVFQQNVQKSRQEQIATLLKPFLQEGEKDAKLMAEIIGSGHQIVSHLVSLYDRSSSRSKIILELIAKRFNRDRTIESGELFEEEGIQLYKLRSRKHNDHVPFVVSIVEEDEFFNSFAKIQTAFERHKEDRLESVLLIRCSSQNPELVYVHHLAKNPLPVSFCSLGLCREEDYSYRTFHHAQGQWQENIRRRAFSPLRYREMRLERMDAFDLELLYHSRYVHVVKLEAKDNSKDQRLFAFVEVPETRFDFSEDQLIQRINAFELGILEAAKAIREQQARHKKAYFWNRIIVHIGHTHPLKLEQVGEYPKKIAGMVEGIGLEKIVIYTHVVGRQRAAIEVEVLVEKFSTRSTTRGRIPSREALKPLDSYATRLVNSMRLQSPYPYEVISMLTTANESEFPAGEFTEYDISFDANGQQTTVSVEGRAPGQNLSNVVFGKIRSRDADGFAYERVLLLGDPSKDLGSLAEAECRRVMAAIDLADQDGIPLEWVPISSGAAIDMQTGTENLDWTARVLRRLIEFTQAGGEINIIVAGINVGAQAYWNAEATMLMHTKGVLIMTENGSMVLTGKKALDFSGSVSAEDNIGIGGVERIMAPNGQAQFRVRDLADAYRLLYRHYRLSYVSKCLPYGSKRPSLDPSDRDVSIYPYQDKLNQGFRSIGDIIGPANAEKKKPFDMRQVLHAVRDQDADFIERWQAMRDAETAIIWETQIGGYPVGLVGIESRPLKRYADVPNDGPESWTGGTLYPYSSKKVARAINAFSAQMPVVVLANLSGFDGSPESLRRLQLEYGAEIGRAVVNFQGPLIFVVIARYHGGAYVVFSKTLNPKMKAVALEGTFASVIGGAPAAAVVFPRQVMKNTFDDPQVVALQGQLKRGEITRAQYDDIFQTVHLEHQAKVAQKFEKIHSVERALQVGSIDDIITATDLRPYITEQLKLGIEDFLQNPKP